MWRERGDLLRTKYDSKKYERESVCKIFGERDLKYLLEIYACTMILYFANNLKIIFIRNEIIFFFATVFNATVLTAFSSIYPMQEWCKRARHRS